MDLILGFGTSGKGVYKRFRDLKEPCVVFDDHHLQDEHPFYSTYTVGLLRQLAITNIIKSPGISPSHPLLQEAQLFNIPVVSDIEWYAKQLKNTTIGITGTNGKTTTTTLVGSMFRKSQNPVLMCGNIGVSLGEHMEELAKDDTILMELSSFQLESVDTFHLRTACLLNLSPAHLDYHLEYEEYIRAKMNIFHNQTANDHCLLPFDLRHYHKDYQLGGRLYCFSRESMTDEGVYIEDGIVRFRDNGSVEELFPIAPFIGRLHLDNLLAATLIAKLHHLPTFIIREVLDTFRGIDHRMEEVPNHTGRIFINDSKSTNPVSTLSAVRTLNRPLTLIVGGKDRNDNYNTLQPLLQEGLVTQLIVYGETTEKFIQLAERNQTPYFVGKDVRHCTGIAYGVTQEGDTILLSPACASWGMYSSFEERGNEFKETIAML